LKDGYDNRDYTKIHLSDLYLSHIDFDARADALTRIYTYKIMYISPSFSGYSKQDFIFRKNYFYFIDGTENNIPHKYLDFEKLKFISKIFEDETYNYTNFIKLKNNSGVNVMRRITKLNINIVKDSQFNEVYFINLSFEAKSFARNQIRILVQIILDYSANKITESEIKELLHMIKIRKDKPCAPPDGLYLSDIIYDQSKYYYHKQFNNDLQEKYFLYRDNKYSKK
jgi:tRNA pseudouridine(38-40) synthase